MTIGFVRVGARLGALGCAAVIATTNVLAQARATSQQSMTQEARVSKDAARMTALGRVPDGRMSTIELRRGVAGELVYIAIIAEAGQTQKTEVVVDAMTGAVVSKRP